LKNELNKSENKSDEKIKELEGQLRVELKKELDNKYSCIIEEVKNEAKANNEEKERYKKELEELKAKTKIKDENSIELKENYKLITELRNIYSSLLSLMRQHDKMKKNNINFSEDILDDLRKVNNAKSILSNLTYEIN